MKMVKVVIPVYKESLEHNEVNSFKQCLKVLGKYPLVLVCPDKLDLSEYEKILKFYNVNINIERFNNSYFDSVYSYNRLMLSHEFYSRFQEYKYILIYQLDSWVFKDLLLFWCKKDYDYIGAPWFEKDGSYEEGMKLSDEVGNGGFSLRKVHFFLNVVNWPYPVLSPMGVIRRFRMQNNVMKTILASPYLFIKILGYRNTIKFYSATSRSHINEDLLWSFFKKDTWLKSKIPHAIEAMKFSFEKSPSYLFELSDNILPFGCHGWEKYGEDFWKSYINND